MASKSKAARVIEAAVQASGKRTFGQKEIGSLLSSAKRAAGFSDEKPAAELLDEIIEAGVVEKRVFASDRYDPYVRYVLPGSSVFETAVSLKRGAYLSHGSAVFLHHLGLQLPRTIYVNKEQSVKPSPTGQLSQEGIDRAFAGQQRESQYVLSYDDWKIVMLNGKNTGNLEVAELNAPDGAPVPATKLERTLIDVAVRPNYAGGVHQVLEAYRAARDRVSVNVLTATLKRIGYIYPYHQVIGFYMQRAGFDESRLTRLRSIGMSFDFYLTYGMKEREYDAGWRLFIPKGFSDA
jgi:hypothetical protein